MPSVYSAQFSKVPSTSTVALDSWTVGRLSVVTGVLAVGPLITCTNTSSVAVVGEGACCCSPVVHLLLTGAGAEHLLDGGVGLVSEGAAESSE